jgi:hypothetical protein
MLSDVDTDISFNYGIFSPGCRRADLADMKGLGIKLTAPSRPASINFADRIRAIASAIK